jgi:hypothetical protein
MSVVLRYQVQYFEAGWRNDVDSKELNDLRAVVLAKKAFVAVLIFCPSIPLV